MTGDARYLVVADFQRSTASVAVGTKVYVLFVTARDEVEIVVRARDGRTMQRAQAIDTLANFRIKRVTEAACPITAWRWARRTSGDCSDLLERCKQLRTRYAKPL